MDNEDEGEGGGHQPEGHRDDDINANSMPLLILCLETNILTVRGGYQPEGDCGNDTNSGMLLFILFSLTNILTACAIDEVLSSKDERKAEAFFKKDYSSHHIIHTLVCKS